MRSRMDGCPHSMLEFIEETAALNLFKAYPCFCLLHPHPDWHDRALRTGIPASRAYDNDAISLRVSMTKLNAKYDIHESITEALRCSM